MNRLKRENQIAAIRLLVEGCSIRSTSRLTGVHRDTIGRLLLRVGRHCERLLAEHMRNLSVDFLEVDELWTFCQKKEGHRNSDDLEEFGDQFIYLGVDATSKIIVHHYVGKRVAETTWTFIGELSERIVGRVQVTTDGFPPYRHAIPGQFGSRADFAMLLKTYQTPMDVDHKYAPPVIKTIDHVYVSGQPIGEFVSTSIVERTNLSVRTFMKRLTRLSPCFSKRLRFLRAAVALFVAWYNFVWIHRSLGMTPAMAHGIVNGVWAVDRLLPAEESSN